MRALVLLLLMILPVGLLHAAETAELVARYWREILMGVIAASAAMLIYAADALRPVILIFALGMAYGVAGLEAPTLQSVLSRSDAIRDRIFDGVAGLGFGTDPRPFSR